jgi:hypothetical protein
MTYNFFRSKTDGKTNPYPLSLAYLKPIISYSFNITGEFGVGILKGIANSNGINTANNDRIFNSDDFKSFYGRLNISFRNQGIEIYCCLGRN